jgi:hypothetical protein
MRKFPSYFHVYCNMLGLFFSNFLRVCSRSARLRKWCTYRVFHKFENWYGTPCICQYTVVRSLNCTLQHTMQVCCAGIRFIWGFLWDILLISSGLSDPLKSSRCSRSILKKTLDPFARTCMGWKWSLFSSRAAANFIGPNGMGTRGWRAWGQGWQIKAIYILRAF